MAKLERDAQEQDVAHGLTAPRRRYLLKTLGCKANLYDSQQIEAELQLRGWKPTEDPASESAELCIINTCTVTDEADRQSRKMAARMAKQNPNAKVVVTGCAAEVDPESLARAKGVHYVVGNRDKLKLVDLVTKLDESTHSECVAGGELLGVAQGYAQMLSRHPLDREWPVPESALLAPTSSLSGAGARTRTFLKIQDGCNSFCTYCVIPYGRGPSRSLETSRILDQIRALVDEGVREVVLTGVNLGDYGTDWSDSPQLERLVLEILEKTRLERLRVSSLDPVEITPGLLELMKGNPRFCPHFHVSLQSPHARVLRLMKRKYTDRDVENCLRRISELPAPVGGAFIGMDVITGFPGESEEEFHWSMDQLARLPWSRLHVFPYSERTGTPATRLPGALSPSVRAARAAKLRELSLERLKSLYHGVLRECQQGGENLESVLIEGKVRGPDGTSRWWSGYNCNYLRVLIPASEDAANEGLRNQILRIRPTRILTDRAGGEVSFMGELAR